MKRSVISIMLIMALINTCAAQTMLPDPPHPKLIEVLEDLFPYSFTQVQYPEVRLYTPQIKIGTSLFSKVTVIDSRFDTTIVGFINVGGGNILVKATPKNLADEITLTVNKLLDSTNKQDGTLLINVRKFYLAETRGAGKLGGRFTFKAGCYLKQDTFYRQLFTIDTVTVVTGKDATKLLLNGMQETFGTFIQRAAGFDTAQCEAKQLTAYDIQHVDESEKKELPVYNIDLPKRGIYTSFEDFKNNQPVQENFIAIYKKGFKRPLVYEATVDNKKGKEISRGNYYAVCDGENVFISAVYGLYPLTKRNGDYYFTAGKSADNAQISITSMATKMFDIMGWMAHNVTDMHNFDYKIDHTTGRFLPVRKTDQP